LTRGVLLGYIWGIMSTTQIRITVPVKLKEFIDALADRYGMGTAAYIKHIVLAEIKRFENLPVRKPSKSTLRAIKQGEKEYREGKMKKLNLDNIDEFFKNL
jgi:predicted DNA-binding protein